MPIIKSRFLALISIVSAAVSVVCMASFGAIAAGVAGGTSIVGMAGMSQSSNPKQGVFLAGLLQKLGLASLMQISDWFIRPFLGIVLLLTIIAAYFSYKKHKRINIFILTIVGALSVFAGIYIFTSEPVYYAGLLVFIISTFWASIITRSQKVIAETNE